MSLLYNGFLGSDGAAALVLMSGKKAQELGLQVIAKITGYADAAQVNGIPFCCKHNKLAVLKAIVLDPKSNALHVIDFGRSFIYFLSNFLNEFCSRIMCKCIAGPRTLHNGTSTCNTKSYFKCWLGGFSS